MDGNTSLPLDGVKNGLLQVRLEIVAELVGFGGVRGLNARAQGDVLWVPGQNR